MLRNHVSFNFGSIDLFVNGLASIVAITLIGAAYFSALGQFAVA